MQILNKEDKRNRCEDQGWKELSKTTDNGNIFPKYIENFEQFTILYID